MIAYDPFEPAVVADPYPVYDWLRDEAPVYYAQPTDTYVLSRYDDVMWAIGDTDLFSSDAMRGVLLGQPTGKGTERLPREAAMGTLVAVDPPAHSELRRIVNRGFTPRRISSWHDRIGELVTDLLAGASDSSFDVVSGLAAPLPVRVIGELLGAGTDHADEFRSWADTLTKSMNGSNRAGLYAPEAATAIFSLASYLGAQIQERQRSPQDDLLTTLVQARGEAVLNEAEALGFAGLLLFAGTETSTNLIGNAVWALMGHPDVRARVIADPTLVPAVLEETLRWESPVQYVFRRSTASFKRHGVVVPVDATITLVLGAANRDPAQWGPTAGDFDPDRDTTGHVSFGFGAHFCLGAALARAEAGAAVEAVLPWLEKATAVVGGDEYIDSFQFRGRRRLDLVR